MQLRRQHEILGLEWHEDIKSADAHDARRAAASALAAYGREAKLGRSALLAHLTARDQAHLELLFREGLGIDRNRARALCGTSKCRIAAPPQSKRHSA